MKIKDYNDAMEFFRTNDYKAADGAWSEFYQSEVLEPRIMDLADGGRIGFKKGLKVKDLSPNYFKAAALARESGDLKMVRATDNQFKDWVSKNISSQSDLNKKHKKLINEEKIFEAKHAQGYLDDIKSATTPLTLGEKQILYKSYDPLFKEEYKRLLALGDPFSKTDINRAVINRIASENPTIDLQKGIGLDKIPGGGNEESKTLFERYDKTSARGPLFNKKELAKFTQGNAVKATSYTQTQAKIFNAILGGNSDKASLAKKLKISEGRLDYNIEKLMRNLSKGGDDQYIFLKKYKEKDLEKVRNAIFESPSLEQSYQRTIVQSVLQSTKLGSPERKKAFQKLKEFNKFKQVMVENGLDPKLLSMDHAASYRAIKNGNIKSFLSVTPVMKDINTLKSSFDRRSQLNLRRMRDYLLAGDTKNYKYFLKNQTELENLWKTMTGGQSSLGKIRVTATGPHKGKIRIYDYGSTSLLDKNKNLLNELADNLDIRKNIVNASTTGNLDEARRIMLEGSELTEKKMLGTLKKTDRAAKTVIDKSFQALDKPEMFKSEKQIMKLLKTMGYRCRKAGGAGEDVACYMSDVEKTRADMKSPNVEVRAKALTKQRKGLQLAQKIPALAKMLRRGIQGTLGVVGLNNPIGWAVEGLIEGGIYDYYRRKGHDHKQAFAETFTPRLAYEGFQGKSTEDVPWYGGSEKLREKELIGDPQQNPKVAQYIDALEEQDRIYSAIGKKEAIKSQNELAELGVGGGYGGIPLADLDAASADVQDLARSGAYRRVDQTLKPESMASQAYNTAVEKRDALDQRRRKDYLEKVEPRFLEREQKAFDTKRHRKKRYEEMDEMYPDYNKEDIDYILKNMYGTSMEKLGEGYTYENIGNFFKDQDKLSYFADNFRMEKAEGGIASLKK